MRGGVCDLSYPTSELRRGRVQGGGNVSPTITTTGGICKVLGRERIKLANVEDYLYKDFGVFKLSPRERGRLMGVKDADIDKMFYETKTWRGSDLLCDAKSMDVNEKQKQLDTDTYALFITKDMSGMDQRKNNLISESTQNVSFVIEKLGASAHSECVTNIIKCLDCTEMRYMLKKDLAQHHTAIIERELNTDVCRNTERLLRITSDGNLNERKLCIILTLTKQIIESKIFTSILRTASINASIASIEDCENNTEKVLLSNLKMVGTYTRVSQSQCYKQYGNSICVPVLMALFSQLGLPGVPKWNDLSQDERKKLITDQMDFLKGEKDETDTN